MSDKSSKERPRFIKPWGYVGYQILFCIPVIGWIINIIFCFSKRHNRRYYARSFWCWILIGLIIAILLGVAGFIFYQFPAGKEVYDKIKTAYTESVEVAKDNLINTGDTETPDEPTGDVEGTTEGETESETEAEGETAAIAIPEALVGTWVNADETVSYQFNANGVGYLKDGEVETTFTFEMGDGNVLSILKDGEVEKIVYTYSLEGDSQLFLTDGGVVTEYTKK